MKKAVKQSRREMKKRIKQLEAQLSPFGGPRLPPVIVERPEVVTLRAERTFSKAFERWRPPKEIVLQDLVQGFGSAVWENGIFTATETPRPDGVKYVVECRVLRPVKGQEYGKEEAEENEQTHFPYGIGSRMSLDRERARRKAVKRKPKQSVVKKEPLSRAEEAWIRGDYALGIHIRGGTEGYV